MKTRMTVAILVTALLPGACNRHSPLPDLGTPVAPSPMPAPTVGPPAMFGLSFGPRALFGSTAGTGTAILTGQAPPGGVVVNLSSADPAAARVPPAVTVPEGADRASFAIETTAVAADHDVVIRASVVDSSTAATLGVWAVLPTFFTWFSEATDDPIGKGGFGRLTAPAARFTSFANTVSGGSASAVNAVSVTVSGPESWQLTVSAPTGAALRLGRYDEATQFANATHPRLSVSGRGTSCSVQTGSFEVRELVVSRDAATGSFLVVDRFDATFEQLCPRSTGALRGEVRYTAGAR
jgi:hypothetical protein